MNCAIKIFERFAAMPDHRTGKRGHCFLRNFDRAGNEKLVVGLHGENVQRAALNVQCLSWGELAGFGGAM